MRSLWHIQRPEAHDVRLLTISVPFCPPVCVPVCFSTRLSACLINPEYGLFRPVRRSYHPSGVPGGEEGPGLLGSQGAAADEGQQQLERGAAAAAEGGREYGGGIKGQAETNQADNVGGSTSLPQRNVETCRAGEKAESGSWYFI